MRHSLNTKIHGIGVDIVEVRRMKDAIDRHGDKFATRILSKAEQDTYLASSNKAQYLAKCWAVKEAFVKAIGTGFKGNFLWKNITYFSPAGGLGLGHPQVRYSDEIKHDSLMDNKIVHLSVSDEQSLVIAYVTIEVKP
tara:strand:- start:11005 stop:11418 length:414 start_codon:yes stop_codon:yes gene_type:complete